MLEARNVVCVVIIIKKDCEFFYRLIIKGLQISVYQNLQLLLTCNLKKK